MVVATPASRLATAGEVTVTVLVVVAVLDLLGRQELRVFWLGNLRDRGHGGGVGCNDADGEVGATVGGCDCGSSD